MTAAVALRAILELLPRRARAGHRALAAAPGPPPAARHVRHRPLHRGVPVQGRRAPLHRLHQGRQVHPFRRRRPAEVPHGRHLRPGLRALLRDGLPAAPRSTRPSASRSSSASSPTSKSTSPTTGSRRSSSTDKKPDGAQGRGHRFSGPAGISAAYHLLAQGLPGRGLRGDDRARRHGRRRHPRVPPAQGGGPAQGGLDHREPRRRASTTTSASASTSRSTSCATRGFQADLPRRRRASRARASGIPGEERSVAGYVTGVKFLLFINHYHLDLGLPMELGERMVVVGGGNVAMDCVRSRPCAWASRTSTWSIAAPAIQHARRPRGDRGRRGRGRPLPLPHPPDAPRDRGRPRSGPSSWSKMEQGEPDASGRRSVRPMEGSHYPARNRLRDPGHRPGGRARASLHAGRRRRTQPLGAHQGRRDHARDRPARRLSPAAMPSPDPPP
jgi:hypothetical protein